MTDQHNDAAAQAAPPARPPAEQAPSRAPRRRAPRRHTIIIALLTTALITTAGTWAYTTLTPPGPTLCDGQFSTTTLTRILEHPIASSKKIGASDGCEITITTGPITSIGLGSSLTSSVDYPVHEEGIGEVFDDNTPGEVFHLNTPLLAGNAYALVYEQEPLIDIIWYLPNDERRIGMFISLSEPQPGHRLQALEILPTLITYMGPAFAHHTITPTTEPLYTPIPTP